MIPANPEIEGQFYYAFRDAAIGMAVVSLEGQFLQVNKALCRLLDYPESALLALDFQSITHPEDLDKDLAQMERLMTGKADTYQIEKRYFDKVGHIIWTVLNVSLVRSLAGEPQYFISQVQDITQRKYAQEELRTQRKLLSTFIERVPAAVAMFDTNMRYLAYSNRWLKDYNIKLPYLYGLSHYDIFPEIPEKQPAWLENHKNCLKGIPLKVEKEEFIRANGDIEYLRYELMPWYDKDDQIGGLLMLTENITALVKGLKE